MKIFYRIIICLPMKRIKSISQNIKPWILRGEPGGQHLKHSIKIPDLEGDFEEMP